jgi:hypothetical protein
MELNADDKIAPHTFEYKGAINITIVLRGDNENRTVRLKSNGIMFWVQKEITFILEHNITLMGHKGNSSNGLGLVCVSDGTFKMNDGAKIIGNDGGGVYVSGIFEMNGGDISGNTPYGVDVGKTFTMNGGTISNNTAKWSGGGVSVRPNATFTMRGGTITGNTAGKNGGGVYLSHNLSIFNKTGGTITGYNSDPNNGNVVKDEDGNVLARCGHAVYCNPFMGTGTRKETTSGTGANLSWGGSKGKTGDWDN